MTCRLSFLALSLCIVACCALVVAGSGSNSTGASDVIVSARTEAVIAADHVYSAQIRDQARVSSNGSLSSVSARVAYHPSVGAAMMWHSASAYCASAASIQDWSCPSCRKFGSFTVTSFMTNSANQGYVGYFTQGLPASPIDDGTGRVGASDPFVLVSFRGTVPSDIGDWIEDLSFAKFGAFSSSHPSVKVHSGFWSSYLSMKVGMIEGIDKALQSSGAKTILFAGHSLGAGMAELAALDLKLGQFSSLNFGVYTQGCPRVGNSAFSALFAQEMDASFREVHQADIVPHLPPELMSFEHGPTEVWWNEAFDQYTLCDDTMDGEQGDCSDSLMLPTSVSDHLHYRNVDIGGYCSSGVEGVVEGAEPVRVNRFGPRRDETQTEVDPIVEEPAQQRRIILTEQ